MILMNASNMYELLGNATYEDVNELLILSGFTSALWSAVRNARLKIEQTGEACTLDTVGRYETLNDAYLQSLKLTLRAAANLATSAEMNGDVSLRDNANALADKLENSSYSFRVYMDLCKKSALNQASDEYLYDVMQKSNTITLLGTPATAQLLSLSDETEETEDSVLYLPNQVDGYPVTTVGQGAWTGDTTITVLVIPDSVRELSDGAFAGCTSLERVILGSGLEHIGANAFQGCSALTSIHLPKKLKSIGQNAFDGCSSLCQVTVSSNEIQADDSAFPENIMFCGTEISRALALSEQFDGYEVLSSALERQPEVLAEPDRYYYAPWEQPDGTGMLLDADGEVVSENWVLCCDTSEPGEQTVIVHYLGRKTSFQIHVGEDELHFPTPYHLQIPTWDEGTAIAAAYNEDGQMIEVLVLPEANGTVYSLPWESEPASVKGFFLDPSHRPLTELTEYVQ